MQTHNNVSSGGSGAASVGEQRWNATDKTCTVNRLSLSDEHLFRWIWLQTLHRFHLFFISFECFSSARLALAGFYGNLEPIRAIACTFLQIKGVHLNFRWSLGDIKGAYVSVNPLLSDRQGLSMLLPFLLQPFVSGWCGKRLGLRRFSNSLRGGVGELFNRLWISLPTTTSFMFLQRSYTSRPLSLFCFDSVGVKKDQTVCSAFSLMRVFLVV